MIAGIITVPGREQELLHTLSHITPHCEHIRIFNDLGRHTTCVHNGIERRGAWWNWARCYAEMLPLAAPDQPVLLATDDVTAVPDWHARWRRIHAQAQGEIYTMFGRKRHVFTPENMRRGWVKGVFTRCFYDVAAIFINQHDLLDRVFAWHDNAPDLMNVNRRTHFDCVLDAYLYEHRIPYVITTPTLFDHVGKTTLGSSHAKIGRSFAYAGDVLVGYV